LNRAERQQQNAGSRITRRTSSGRVIRLSPATRYAVAVGVAVGAVLLRLAFDPVWGVKLPYITLFPAIMLSAWLGGLWPGIVTTLITGTAAEYFWMEPVRSWAVTDRSELLGTAVFVAVGIVISVLNEAWRRGMDAVVESEGRLDVTLSSIGDAVIATDNEGRVTRLNAIAEQLTGWTEEDAIGRPLKDVFVIINEESRQPAENPVYRVLRDGAITGLANHTLLVSKDGREITIDDSAAPIRTAEGRMAGVVMVFRDITERRRAERERTGLLEAERSARREIETAEQQLQTALQAGRMGTWQYTIATGGVRWSPGLEAIHGLAPGTFAGSFEAFRNEIYPADRDQVLKAIGAAVSEGRDHRVEYRIVRPDGAVRWVEGVGKILEDEEGRPDRMVGVCTDITERKQSEERFRLAVEAAPAAMIMVDQRGTIILINALTEQLLGYSRNELVGQSVDRFVPSRFRDQHAEHRRGFFSDSRPRPMGAGRDLFAVRRDGTEVPVEIGLSPIQTADGLLVLAAVTDITERKRVEEERSRLLVREHAARTEIERASRLKDEFLAVLSHELRTPLNAVLGYSRLLRSGVLPPDRAGHALEAIERNAHAQARLVESLLDLSRVMAGKLELDLQTVNLSEIVEAALDVVRPDAEAKGVTLAVIPPQSAITLVGDSGRLQQVFWNLLSNAVKFTPRDGRITVRWDKQNGGVRIEVSDDGQGISADFLPHIFERFTQADSRKRRSPAGLGLGLALVREMVHAHGGTVIAESLGEGRGTTFVVTLPVSSGAAALAPEKTSQLVLDPVASLGRIDILVVDDDGDARDLIALLLESRGAVAHTVSSAAEALEAIRQRRPDVLLADLRMPHEDGYSLIRRLRDREREHGQQRLPAVAVTAYASPSDRERAIAAGFDWHVTKPVDPEDLARAIAKVARADSV
jgi:PAS domain S-box-containing protein